MLVRNASGTVFDVRRLRILVRIETGGRRIYRYGEFVFTCRKCGAVFGRHDMRNHYDPPKKEKGK